MNNTAQNPPRMTAEEYFKVTAETTQPTELIDGEIVGLASPNTEHQRIVREIGYLMQGFIKSRGGDCETFSAPYDVVLDDENVVQPDFMIVCDPSKITKKNCCGAPDLIVEVLSGNRGNDLIRKQRLYKSAGVREYWIIDPQGKKVWVYHFEQQPNVVELYDWTDTIPVGIYSGAISVRIADFL